jgi:histidine triad (HIT) family protein
MYNKENIFAKIIRKEINADIIYENQDIIAFKDITPVANIHVLVIPKGEYTSYSDFIANADDNEIASFFKSVKHVIELLNIEKNGYRLLTNHGDDAGQTVEHYHVHIIAGEKLESLNARSKE